MLKKASIIVLLLNHCALYGTHNKAGAITWKHLEGKTYKLRITTMTGHGMAVADRCSLAIYVTKYDSVVLQRVNGITFSNCNDIPDGEIISATARVNIYEGTYTFPCEGAFTLSCRDPNRNAGIINIPNSVNIPFYMESEIFIAGGEYSCSRNSVEIIPREIILSAFPSQRHCPAILNQNGDSLSFSLVSCKSGEGKEVPGYTAAGFTIDDRTGLVSSNISVPGEYNLCVRVTMHRNGQYTGSVEYDYSLTLVPGSADNTFSSLQISKTAQNGVYGIGAGETLTLAGVVSATPATVTLISGLSGSAQLPLANQGFSASVAHTEASSRSAPYRLILSITGKQKTMRDSVLLIRLLETEKKICTIPLLPESPCETRTRPFEFYIFPVITDGKISFSHTLFESFAVYDMLGRPLTGLPAYEKVLNVEHVASGVYLLVIKFKDFHDLCFKFVKM